MSRRHRGNGVGTGNAADPAQVARAGRTDQERAERDLSDMQEALQSAACRRVLWRLMYEARTGLAHAVEDFPHLTASVFDPSARIHYNSGRQDLGHLLQGWIRQADPYALSVMLLDAIREDEQRLLTESAARTPRATMPNEETV